MTRTGPALGAAVGSYAAYIYLGLKTPMPGETQDVATGLEVERREFVTTDGLTLRPKRYANPGGVPVLLCHGFGGNGNTFDLPREGRNMAVHLARDGFDVWVSSFRGCGREPYRSDEGDWRHSMDHLAIYDASALVEGILSVTGKPVFWVGHSMGGFVLYMYLQGARFAGGDTVVSDPGLVAERHGKLAGAVTLGAPGAFSWPADDPERKGVNRAVNRRYVEHYIRVMREKESSSPRIHRRGSRNGFLRSHPRITSALVRTPLAVNVYNRANTDRDATTALVYNGRDDVSAAMWLQRLESVLGGDLVQHRPVDRRVDAFNYTRNMHLITLPVMFITGDRDYNPRMVESFAYEIVSSVKKEFVRLPGYGHIDMLMGRNVASEVYPLISAWIKEVAGGGPARDEEGVRQ